MSEKVGRKLVEIDSHSAEPERAVTTISRYCIDHRVKELSAHTLVSLLRLQVLELDVYPEQIKL